MQTNLENIGGLERRLNIAVPSALVSSEVDSRLKKLAQTVRLHGFRPGKVPFKVVEKRHGDHVRQEVIGENLQKRFVDVVREQSLRVVGYPHFEAKSKVSDVQYIEYSATFEVYPVVVLGDITQVSIRRPKLDIDEAEVERTIEILRKQRRQFSDVKRAVAVTDQVHIDFVGKIEGKEFNGSSAKDFSLIVGEGSLFKEFDEKISGMMPGEEKVFNVTLPTEYHDKNIAGKVVTFTANLHGVAEERLPALDSEFAKQLGVESGDLTKMREGVKSNLMREVRKRVDARIKDQVMQSLIDLAKIDPPKILVAEEIQRLIQMSRQSLEASGVKVKDLPISPDMFEEQARKNVSLGIIFGELVKSHGLDAKPDQVKKIVQQHADTYEHPEEVVRWYYQNPDRLKGVEGLTLEGNVVDWVLGKVKIEEENVSFEELMGKNFA